MESIGCRIKQFVSAVTRWTRRAMGSTEHPSMPATRVRCLGQGVGAGGAAAAGGGRRGASWIEVLMMGSDGRLEVVSQGAWSWVTVEGAVEDIVVRAGSPRVVVGRAGAQVVVEHFAGAVRLHGRTRDRMRGAPPRTSRVVKRAA